jgi:hypothetical protein
MTKKDDSRFTEEEKDAIKSYHEHGYGLQHWSKSTYDQDLAGILMHFENDDPNSFSATISRLPQDRVDIIFNLLYKFYPSRMKQAEALRKDRNHKITKPVKRKSIKKCKCK